MQRTGGGRDGVSERGDEGSQKGKGGKALYARKAGGVRAIMHQHNRTDVTRRLNVCR